jgi:arsenate reductase-like glutaredoxin family protein
MDEPRRRTKLFIGEDYRLKTLVYPKAGLASASGKRVNRLQGVRIITRSVMSTIKPAFRGKAMSVKIDWLYHRKNCVTCQRARDFIAAEEISVLDQADARKERRDPEQALALAKEANKIIVAKGAKVVMFDMKKDPPDDATLLAHLIGPTGNLRAPAVVKGKTLLIGFNEEAYKNGLGI